MRIDKSNNGAGILAMSGARGNATLTNVTITNSADGNIVIQPGSQFVDQRRLIGSTPMPRPPAAGASFIEPAILDLWWAL